MPSHPARVEEVIFAEFHLPGTRGDSFVEAVHSRDYTKWDLKIPIHVCGFRVYSSFIGCLNDLTDDTGNVIRVTSCDKVNYSSFHYCNGIVMSWDEAKRRYSGYDDDPRKSDHVHWSDDFWRADWNPTMKVFYFRHDEKVYPALHNFSSAFPQGFVCDEDLKSSEIK